MKLYNFPLGAIPSPDLVGGILILRLMSSVAPGPMSEGVDSRTRESCMDIWRSRAMLGRGM